MIPAVLAVDGGNSKTDVLLLGSDGSVRACVRGPGASPQKVGVRRCLDLIEHLAGKASVMAGLGGDRPFATHTSACLAGADLPREEAELRTATAQRGWSRSVVVENDTFAVLRAGTTTGVGVAVVCGAGINCVGVGEDGTVSRFPALGGISGDWGGGAFLGREALWWAVRAEDGRGPSTALLPAVLRHFAVGSTTQLVEAIHFDEVAAAELHSLCPVLFDVAAEGDAVATGLVDRLAEEISSMILVTLGRLNLPGEPVEVVLGGGVLAAQRDRVVPMVRTRCERAASYASIDVVQVPPMVGAGLLGLDRIAASPEAYGRLRGTEVRPRVVSEGAQARVRGSGDAVD